MSTEVTHKKGDISQLSFLILGWKGYSMLSLVGEEHLKATARHYKRLPRETYDVGIATCLPEFHYNRYDFHEFIRNCIVAFHALAHGHHVMEFNRWQLLGEALRLSL